MPNQAKAKGEGGSDSPWVKEVCSVRCLAIIIVTVLGILLPILMMQESSELGEVQDSVFVPEIFATVDLALVHPKYKKASEKIEDILTQYTCSLEDVAPYNILPPADSGASNGRRLLLEDVKLDDPTTNPDNKIENDQQLPADGEDQKKDVVDSKEVKDGTELKEDAVVPNEEDKTKKDEKEQKKEKSEVVDDKEKSNGAATSWSKTLEQMTCTINLILATQPTSIEQSDPAENALLKKWLDLEPLTYKFLQEVNDKYNSKKKLSFEQVQGNANWVENKVMTIGNTDFVYTGQVVNGKAHGFGRFYNDDILAEGQLQNGQEEGILRVIDSNGRYEIGQVHKKKWQWYKRYNEDDCLVIEKQKGGRPQNYALENSQSWGTMNKNTCVGFDQDLEN